MHILKIATAMVAALLLVACSPSQQQSIQTAVDRNILHHTVGKEYAKVSKQQNTTQDGLFGKDSSYGNLVSIQKLTSGDTIYKHVDEHEATKSSFGVGWLDNTNKRIDLRLMYFRVGPDGIIKDYANGGVTGGEVSCVEWIGGLIKNCENDQQLAKDVAQMDLVVRTSDNQPLSSWK